jgi:hypothetical protein
MIRKTHRKYASGSGCQLSTQHSSRWISTSAALNIYETENGAVTA